MSLLKRLWQDESAISAVEYGIIAAVVAVALIGVLKAFNVKIAELFTGAGDQIAGAGPT